MKKKLSLFLVVLFIMSMLAVPAYATETITLSKYYTVSNVTSNTYDSTQDLNKMTATAPVTIKIVDQPSDYLFSLRVALADLSDPEWRYSDKSTPLPLTNAKWSLITMEDGVVTGEKIVTEEPGMDYIEMYTMLSGEVTITEPGLYLVSAGRWAQPSMGTLIEVTAGQKVSSVKRMGGRDRFETSNLIAQSMAPTAVDTVILATGNDWSDALLGSTLSKKYNAPILLVDQTPQGSEAALSFIRTSLKKEGKVIIVGQESVIPQSFEETIAGLGIQATNIQRITASSRGSLSVATAKFLSPSKGATVVIASELDYPDALSISSYASNQQSPIILVPVNQIPEEQWQFLQELAPNRVIIVGGTGVISSGIEEKLRGLTANVERYAGQNRYETSTKILKALYNSPSEICFAYGENYPDALSGSAYAAYQSAPILVIPSELDQNMINFLTLYKGASPTLFGGTGVISKTTESTLVETLK